MYKALYRQYRPVTFDDVFGQDTIVKTLKNSIIHNSYSHAYMFFGPRGTGKTSVSKIFARSLNCLDPKDGNSCGKCKNCLASYEKECVDIIEIDAASNNGVDEIRELKNKISLVPAELKYKVYIIDEVHMLSIGAFNALLKTLEEPPEHVIFILATTDPQKVPETIISRCQCFSFKRISTDNIVTNLKRICKSEKIKINDDVLDEIAYSCNGGMRDALSTLDQLHSYCDETITLDEYAEVNGTLTNNEIHSLYESIFNAEYATVLDKIKRYNDEGKNIISIIDRLMRYIRGMMIAYYIDKNECAFCVRDLTNFVLLINEKMNDIKKSSNPMIYIEMILLDFMNHLKMDSEPIKVEESTTSTIKISKKSTPIVENNEELITPKPSNINNLKESEVPKNDEKKSTEKVDNDKKISTKVVEEEKIESSKSDSSSKNKILNIDEIIKVRVHNTLANANKELKMRELSTKDLFNDYTFDQEIGFIASSIIDSQICCVSEDCIVLGFDYDSIVKQNLLYLDKFTEVYNMITNSNKKLAMITNEEWESYTKQYIADKAKGIVYTTEDEPEEVFLPEENNDIINNEAVQLFGDIVEIK